MKYFIVIFFAVAAQAASESTNSTDSPDQIVNVHPISDAEVVNIHQNITAGERNLDTIAYDWLSRPKYRRNDMNYLYKQMYSQTVEEAVNTHQPKDFALTFAALMYSDTKNYATRLRAAMNGQGTIEEMVIDTLVTMRSDNIVIGENQCLFVSVSDLKGALVNRTSEEFQGLLEQISTINRHQNQDMHKHIAAYELTMFCESFLRSDDEFPFLTGRDFARLRHLFEIYEHKCRSDIEKYIENKYTEHTRTLLLALVKLAGDEINYFAEKIHEAIEKKNIESVIFHLTSRYGKDLDQIKERYQTNYGHSIVADLQKTFPSSSRVLLENMLSGKFRGDA